MMSLCETGGVVQLQRKKTIPSTPPNPNSVDSLLEQEVSLDLQLESCYENEQYSDIGYPTLPRPKAILSLTRKGLPWSLQQASKLSTVPVRIRSRTESDIGAVCPAVKANRESNQILSKQNKRKSISDLWKSNSNSSPVSFSVGPPAPMNNHSRVQSRKPQGNAAAAEGEEGQKKTKKSRKPSKSLTFSFGSNSDKKRRTLGFLGRGEKKSVEKSVEKSSPVTPDSPILVSRKTKTLPSSSRNTELSPARNGTTKSYHGSYQDIAGARSLTRALTRKKARPPPLPNLSGSASGGLVAYNSSVGAESPLHVEHSPALTSATSGLSSRQESSESLSYRSESSQPASLASSRGPSPNPSSSRNNTSRTRTARGRKLSDPVMSTPTHTPDTSPPQPRPSTLKKRYTFSVRSTRVNAERANTERSWVSEPC